MVQWVASKALWAAQQHATRAPARAHGQEFLSEEVEKLHFKDDLVAFVQANEGQGGMLPLDGSIPDMHSTTE